MLIAEFTLSTPVLRDALAAAPGTTVDLEQTTAAPPTRLSVLARGEDLNRFEEALPHDDSVAESSVAARSATFGQYELTLSSDAADGSLTVWASTDGVEPLSGVGTNRGWEFRMRFADEAALSAYRDHCRDRGAAFTLHDLYVREEGGEERLDAGVDAPAHSSR